MAPFNRKAKRPEDLFADEVVALVLQLTGARAVKRPGFALEVARPGRQPVTINLQNVYAEASRSTGQERAEALRATVLGLAGPPEVPSSWEEAAPRLRPAVRAVSSAAAGSAHGALLRRPLAPFVQLCFVLDWQYSMAYVKEEHCGTWGTGRDDVERAAAENLTREPMPVATAGQVALVLGPDGYTSSWLAVPRVLQRAVGDIGPSVVALAPGRDELRLVDLAATEVLVRQLAEVLAVYQGHPRPLSPLPYLMTDDGLVPWRPPPGHPAAGSVRWAERVLAFHEYERQQEALQKLMGEDVAVASYKLRGRGDGEAWSWAAWLRDVDDALIPEVDRIIASDTEDKTARFMVSWADAMEVAGAALVPEPGYDPPRWRYHGWADEATMAALRRRAIPWPGVG